jgi:pyruvate kinase
MGIRKKDRSFEEILKDVVMEEVPIEYITHIQLKLKNGDSLEFSQEELAGLNTASEVLKSQGLEHLKDNIQDIEVFIDSAKIKGKVVQYVKTLLVSQFGDEK